MSKRDIKKCRLSKLKHKYGGDNVRQITEHLKRDYEWESAEREVPRKHGIEIVRYKRLTIDGIPVKTDIKHVFNILLANKFEDMVMYLLSDDAGLRRLAEKRHKELECDYRKRD